MSSNTTTQGSPKQVKDKPDAIQVYKAVVAPHLIGTYLSEIQYYKVLGIFPDGRVQVENERGMEMNISPGIVEEGMYSSHQINSQEKISRTKLIELFSSVGDAIFTVSYNKQPKSKDIKEAIKKLNKGKILSTKEMETVIDKAYEGEERELTGYLIKVETGFGRSLVIDLEADKVNRYRQVDHRSLNWMIYKGVKYIAD